MGDHLPEIICLMNLLIWISIKLNDHKTNVNTTSEKDLENIEPPDLAFDLVRFLFRVRF